MVVFVTGELVTATKLNTYTCPPGGIIVWTGTIANIPTGWLICDGNNGTPNLLTRFLQGVATAATNPGTTGGATNKTTAGAHYHTLLTYDVRYDDGLGGLVAASESPGGILYRWTGTGSGATGYIKKADTDTVSATIIDIRPLYYDVAFLMKT